MNFDFSPKPGKKGLARIIAATGYSLRGLGSAWRHEAAFRQELVALLLCVPAAFWLGQTASQQAILLFSCGLVLVTELLNSAIEAIVDRVSTEHHPLSGQAKDLGSAAVFVSILFAILVWSIVASHRFLA